MSTAKLQLQHFMGTGMSTSWAESGCVKGCAEGKSSAWMPTASLVPADVPLLRFFTSTRQPGASSPPAVSQHSKCCIQTIRYLLHSLNTMNPAAMPCFCSTVSHAELDANGEVTLLSDIFPQTLQHNLCFWGVHGARPALVCVMCVSQWLFGLQCSSSQTPVTLHCCFGPLN